MPNLYVITDSVWKTENGLRWGYGVHHTAGLTSTPGRVWLSLTEFLDYNKDQYLFAYTHPVLAMLFYRVDTTIHDPILWQAAGKVRHITIDGIAHCSELSTTRDINCPSIGLETRMRFGFACVHKVYNNTIFEDYILDWYSGKDRSRATAERLVETFGALARYEEAREGAQEAERKRVWAAHWMCLAATNYREDISIKDRNLMEYWTGMAAMEAARVAYLSESFLDLVGIAEMVMAAK